jgi:hypothetical protein
MANKIFSIVPASASMYLAISGIFLVMLIPLIALGFSFCQHIKPFSRIAFIELSGMVLIIAVGALFVYFGYSARNTKFVISERGLRIKGCLYGRRVPKDSLITEDIQIVDLLHADTYRPTKRTNGVGLPGYLEGWFRLNTGEKALLFLTEKTRVVYIPTKGGYSVLLSPTQPKEFLQTIHQLWKD